MHEHEWSQFFDLVRKIVKMPADDPQAIIDFFWRKADANGATTDADTLYEILSQRQHDQEEEGE